jgi:2-octaprenylphenol hydroxylase
LTAEAYDLIVVGGGLIGAAAALGAGRQGRRVMLLEKAQPGAVSGRFGMDIRNVSVSPGSRRLLSALGVWNDLPCAPFVGMHVWEEQGTEALDFSAADVDRQELGWIVENAHLVSALWAALEALESVDMAAGESLEQLAVESSCVTVTTDAGQYRGKLLVAADGARSRVRHLLGLETVSYPTGHNALVTLLQTERPHQGIAHQRFLLDGPLALLPSAEPDRVSVVWSQSPEQAERRQALSDLEFCREIGAASEHQLGEVVACDDRHVFPLIQHLVANFNPGQRLLLLGDAARVLHPLAGLGANVGFEDVRDFLDRLKQLPEGQDAGSRGIWKSFARHRRTRAQLMLGLMTALREVYSEDDPYLQWLRNLGVKLTARATPVRRQVIREALGLGPLARSW